ncbi:hypothetical protein ESZ50_07895 [Weissella muntiaci]|uniref:Uncharacterized protein n=1 Tax=Weissella muntiaci TaxID=2508881 RepID=A0A6C2C4C9_9LACO|nr:hypothetical protein [Weissella muntiaci]TYC48790.1 hypothetical protein ESZ50_07895 [Weissella muntiaci]
MKNDKELLGKLRHEHMELYSTISNAKVALATIPFKTTAERDALEQQVAVMEMYADQLVNRAKLVAKRLYSED